MIKELEEVLEIQKEVDALKAKILSKVTETKNIADESINARKKQIEQELAEIVRYVQTIGAYNIHGAYVSQIITRINNYPVTLFVDDSNFHLGFTKNVKGRMESCLYGYHSTHGWDCNVSVEFGSSVTDFICVNWDDIKAFLINDIKTVAQAKQTKDLSDAMSQLQMQISRTLI